MNLDVTLGAAFVAGLLSFLSPCILPLVPPFLCYMAGVSVTDLSTERPDLQPRILLSALTFVAGFSLVFIALGSTASVIGRFISEHLSMLGILAGVLIIVMGLHFLGVFRIPLLYRSGKQAGGPRGRFRHGTCLCLWLDTLRGSYSRRGSANGRFRRHRKQGRPASPCVFGGDGDSFPGRGRFHGSFRQGAWPRAPTSRRRREDDGGLSGGDRSDVSHRPDAFGLGMAARAFTGTKQHRLT
jgi:hypothetical protein